MANLISRVVLAIEIAVLGLLAVPLAVIAAFGVMSIHDLKGLLFLLASALVCAAFVSTADLAIRRIRNSQNIDEPDFGVRQGIALGGAVVATVFTAYGRLFLSAHEQWAQGIDFISVGCFIWIPLIHLWISFRAERRTSCPTADGGEGP
jgi:hypothetical protein